VGWSPPSAAFIVSGLTFHVDQWAGILRRLRLSFQVSRFTLISGLNSFVIRHPPFVIALAFALAHLLIGSLANYACLLARAKTDTFIVSGFTFHVD